MNGNKFFKAKNLRPGRNETLDNFFCGRIKILQKKSGYRFSLDAPLLADFIRTQKNSVLLELGSGSGIISLLLSFKPFDRIIALEIQKELADLAQRNVVLNGLEDRIMIVHTDLRTYKTDRKFDVIFSNPPYIKKNSGFLSPAKEKSIAKHEIKCSLSDIMLRTSELLKPKGNAYFIFPKKRQEEFMEEVHEKGLAARSIRLVRPRLDAPANLFLCELVFPNSGPNALKEHPPLVLYDEKGGWSSEAESVFSGPVESET